jgi:ATP-dependent Zn protease
MARSRAAEKRLLKRVAYHEAGHAVAAIEFRRAFKSVTVIPGANSLGHVLMHRIPQSVIDDHEGGSGNLVDRFVEKDLLVSLAGPAAECEFFGRFDHRGASGDYRNCEDMALHIYDDVTAGKYIAFLFSRARAFVRRANVWIRIEAVAEALIVHKTLSARKVRGICFEAWQNAERFKEICAMLRAREEKRQEKLRALYERQNAK